MIKSFRNKALLRLWETGTSAGISSQLHKRILVRLDALDQALLPEDMNLSGFNFHMLKGFTPIRYTIHVNGPWCITFEFLDGDAYRVDLEQYH